jgi:hypothetical protein
MTERLKLLSTKNCSHIMREQFINKYQVRIEKKL